MGGLGAETLGTETFLVLVPLRPKMFGLVKVSVSQDFIIKSWSRFHETNSQSLGLGLNLMRPKIKVTVSVFTLKFGSRPSLNRNGVMQ